MLLMQLVTGILPEPPVVTFGPFDVPVERIATVAKIQGAALYGSGIPLGAAAWAQALDPADHLPFGISFIDLLDNAETIASVERLAVSSAGAALGLTIDSQGGNTSPIIDESGARRVQLWLSIGANGQSSPLFDGTGVRVAIACRIVTTKARRFDRSAVLTVRQQ